MSKYAVALMLVLASTVAWAVPEGSWPESSRGHYLPTAKWILVIPAKREADGSVSLWNKDDPWTKSWIVPKATPQGVKTVAISGDSEDKRLIAGWQLDEMDLSALNTLASKYSAPAVAVVVRDVEGKAAVAGWVPNHEAAWDSVFDPDAHSGSLLTMDNIFSGLDNKPASADSAVNTYDVAITGQRNIDGFPEYRVEAEQEIIIDVLRGLQGIEMTEIADQEKPSVIVKVTDGRDIETVLRSAGLGIR